MMIERKEFGKWWRKLIGIKNSEIPPQYSTRKTRSDVAPFKRSHDPQGDHVVHAHFVCAIIVIESVNEKLVISFFLSSFVHVNDNVCLCITLIALSVFCVNPSFHF